MKRFTAFVLLLCMALTLFAACGSTIDDTPTTQPAPETEVTEPADQQQSDVSVPENAVPQGETWNGIDIGFVSDNGLKYIWDQLDDNMKEDYAAAMNAIKNEELSVVLPHGIPKEQMMDFIQFIYHGSIDYPYIGKQFYLSDIDGDDLLESYVISYDFTVAPDVEGAKALVSELNQKLDEIVAGMPDGTEYEKIKYLHDYLIFNCDYSENASLPFTAYGAIVEKNATCQGYADAMHLLLTRAGFEAMYTIGRGDRADVTHKWNYVRLSDGQWYIIDPTWADPTGKGDPNYINYDYFLISDEEILLDHLEKHDCIYYTNPVATSMEMCYHKSEGCFVTNFDEAYASAMEQALACANEGRRYIYLRTTDEETYNDIRAKLLVDSKDDPDDGKLGEILAAVKEQTGVEYVTWSVYRAHKDGKGPLCFTVTIKKDGE